MANQYIFLIAIMVFVVSGMLGVVRAEMLVSDAGVEYDSEIINKLNDFEWVKIIIDLKDSSYANNLISTLSEKNAKNIIHRDISPGTIGVDITEEEFNKLVNDSRINKIYFNAPVHGTDKENQTNNNKEFIGENEETGKEGRFILKNSKVFYLSVGAIVLTVLFIVIYNRYKK